MRYGKIYDEGGLVPSPVNSEGSDHDWNEPSEDMTRHQVSPDDTRDWEEGMVRATDGALEEIELGEDFSEEKEQLLSHK